MHTVSSRPSSEITLQMKKRFFYTAAVLMAAVFLLLVGCTQLERDGFSAIPQNSPASWEYTPYGM